MSTHPILINGEWTPSSGAKTFQASNPRTREISDERYPISEWKDIEKAIGHASEACEALRATSAEARADFLEQFADRVEWASGEFAAIAHFETGLPAEGRFTNVELPRMANQLRQFAGAIREGSWVRATIDSKANIRSMLGPIGPVVVIGPNNFPFAFNGMGGGDFAAAIAAGNPVIAKGHPLHPGTTRRLAEIAAALVQETGLPPASVQLLYHFENADGFRLVSHPKIGATSFTGSRTAGLALKQAADAAGKPIYLEMGSLNPVAFLPGALAQRSDALIEEFKNSMLAGGGQFCTKPGLALMVANQSAVRFIRTLGERLATAPVATLLSEGVQAGLAKQVKALVDAGAMLVIGGKPTPSKNIGYANTLLRVDGRRFLEAPALFQVEAFGNAALAVVAHDEDELIHIVRALDGSLTGSIYAAEGVDEALYARLEPVMRQRVGRLLNDKMPTGVAVTPAMNHGGPYPATGHPGFTAVGAPAAMLRFTALWCYDAVRDERLPAVLRNVNLPNRPWRYVDGAWTRDDVKRS